VIVVLCVEGVLSEVGVPLHEAGPTLFGRRLYTTLRAATESIFMVSTDTNRQMVKEWLLRENFDDYVRLVVRDDSDLPPVPWKIEVVNKIVAQGHHVSYMVDREPSVLTASVGLGIPSLLAMHAMDAPGRVSRNDSSYKDWGSLVDTMEDQALRQAELRRQRRESGNED
jgi:hypothetical protein